MRAADAEAPIKTRNLHSKPNETHDAASWSAADAFAVCLLAALALAIYQPWATAPLDSIDLSEALPFYRGEDSFSGRLAALNRHYTAAWGRLTPVLLAWYSAQWTLFGESPIGWQIVAFLLMLANTFGTYTLLRRLDLDPIAAVAGASVMVVGTAAADPWSKGLYYGEPLVLALVLGAAHLAADYDVARWPVVRALAIAGCVATAVLSKEIAIACVPFVMGVALLRTSGEWRVRLPRRRDWMLVAAVGAAVVASVVPILVVRAHAPSTSYGAKYSFGAIRLDVARQLGSSMFMPTFNPGGTPFVRPADIVLLALIMGGILLAARARRSPLLGVSCALLAVLGGAAIYLPWYYFRADYALPFALGPALLVAIAATGYATLPQRRHRVLVAAVGGALMVLAARSNASSAARSRALRVAEGALREVVVAAARSGFASAVYAVDRQNQQEWLAARQRRVAEGMAFPALLRTTQLSCVEAADSVRSESGRHVVVTLPGNCLMTPWPRAPDARIVAPYRYFSIRKVTVFRDSVLASVWRPGLPHATSARVEAR